MARRARGEGTIVVDDRGKRPIYRLIVKRRHPATGQVKTWKPSFATKSAASAALPIVKLKADAWILEQIEAQKAPADRDAQQDLIRSDLTFAAWLDEWQSAREKIVDRIETTGAIVADAKRLSKRSTLRSYDIHLPRLKSYWGATRISAITPSACKRFSRHLNDDANRIGEKTGCSELQCWRVFTKAIADAFNADVIDSNPTFGVEAPQYLRRTQRCFSRDEVREILAAVGDKGHPAYCPRFEALIWLLALSGMRVGEALGLRWEDINFDTREIAIRRTLSEREGCGEQRPKNGKVRFVAVDDLSLARLRSFRQLQSAVSSGPEIDRLELSSAADDEAPIFIGERGGRWLARNVGPRLLHPVLDRLKIKRGGFHAFRRANISSLSSEVSEATVRDRVGHSDLAQTRGYQSRVREADHAAAQIAARVLTGSEL